MKPIRSYTFFAALAVSVLCSCSKPPIEIDPNWKSVPYIPSPNADQERRELDLREFIFRQEIANPIRDEIVYLSFGYDSNQDWIEPPQGFIERLADIPVIVRSVADANLFIGGMTSKTDNRVGHIYYVQILEWQSENSVKVNHALYGGPLYSGGVDGAIYEYIDGQWRIKTNGKYHISLNRQHNNAIHPSRRSAANLSHSFMAATG